MIAAFERRFADLLGTRLAAPLAGAVDVAPGDNGSALVVGVAAAEPDNDALWRSRPERVPGTPDPRRVVALRCDVTVTARAADRDDRVAALDQALHLLDAPEFQIGAAFAAAAGEDPGFLIRRLLLARMEGAVALHLSASGLFWPPGMVGEAGEAIRAVLLRAPLLPLALRPERPVIVAGGPPVALTIALAEAGGGRIEADGIAPAGSALPVLARVVDAGGRPGAGTLSGGSAGPAGSRLLPVTDGAVELTYTPPAEPALDLLVVTLEAAGGFGVELGRFALAGRAAP